MNYTFSIFALNNPKVQPFPYLLILSVDKVFIFFFNSLRSGIQLSLEIFKRYFLQFMALKKKQKKTRNECNRWKKCLTLIRPDNLKIPKCTLLQGIHRSKLQNICNLPSACICHYTRIIADFTGDTEGRMYASRIKPSDRRQ